MPLEPERSAKHINARQRAKRFVLIGILVFAGLLCTANLLGEESREVKLFIPSECITCQKTGEWILSTSVAGNPGSTEKHYCDMPVIMTGHNNTECKIHITVQAFKRVGPHKDWLETWVMINGEEFPVKERGTSVFHRTVTWDGTGDWEIEINVGVQRHGYQDAAGTYEARVHVTCAGGFEEP